MGAAASAMKGCRQSASARAPRGAPELVDERLHVRALGGLRLRRALGVARALAAGLLERVVVALVRDQLCVVQVQDVGAHGVEELAGVGDDLTAVVVVLEDAAEGRVSR